MATLSDVISAGTATWVEDPRGLQPAVDLGGTFVSVTGAVLPDAKVSTLTEAAGDLLPDPGFPFKQLQWINIPRVAEFVSQIINGHLSEDQMREWSMDVVLNDGTTVVLRYHPEAENGRKGVWSFDGKVFSVPNDLAEQVYTVIGDVAIPIVG